MNQHQIADLSAELIIKYYDNDYMPFLSYMDDDALWYGPAEGQFIRGRENMIRIWNDEEHSLRFTLGNMEVLYTSTHPSFCDVILTYSVTTHYPDRDDITMNQRLLFTWGERALHDKKGNIIKDEHGNIVKTPHILVCCNSSPHEKHSEDVIYHKNFHEIYYKTKEQSPRGKRICFCGKDRSEYFILSDTVIFIEAAHGGKHSVLHTDDGVSEILLSVSAVEKLHPGLFLRCHQSYLVNPERIRNIRRFELTLSDGTVLPIPEKKYTAFREKAVKETEKTGRSKK